MNTSNKFLTKKACVNPENKCNFEEPYYYLELNKIIGKNIVNNSELEQKELQYKHLCMGGKRKFIKCCDPNDNKLNNIINDIDPKIREKYSKIKVVKEGDKIKSINVCTDNILSEQERREEVLNEEIIDEEGNTKKNKTKNKCIGYQPATPYEMCKLIDSKIDPITGVASNLLPDCFKNKCNPQEPSRFYPVKYYENYNYFEDLELHNMMITDDINALRKKVAQNIDLNRILVHDSKGNTLLHEAINYDATKCFNFLIRYNVKLDIKNVDGNIALHMASILGKNIIVYELIKLGSNINETNLVNDTPLHCAIISGDLKTTLVLLNNGASIYTKNKEFHTPFYTSIRCQNKNLNIVKLLVDYGSDLFSIDKNNNTVLKTLQNQKKTKEGEKIRTYLNKIYYDKYKDNYNEMVKKYPEIAPYDISSEDNEYDIMLDYSDNLKSEKLYFNKSISPLKYKIPIDLQKNDTIETFIGSCNNNQIKLLLIILSLLIVCSILIFK